MDNYKFSNNGFKIIWKPLTGLTIVVSFIMLIVFIGMIISKEYDYLDALKVLVIIPAIDIIMLIFFSIYFLVIWFSFELEGSSIVIGKWIKKYKFNLNDIESIDVSLKYREQNYILLKTSNLSIKLFLLGTGGRFMYDDLFKVIDEIKTNIPRIDMSIMTEGDESER